MKGRGLSRAESIRKYVVFRPPGSNPPAAKAAIRLWRSTARLEAAPCQSGARRVLRRGMFFNPGIVPPRAASLRAASRSVMAFRACRSDAVFFAIPSLWHRVWLPVLRIQQASIRACEPPPARIAWGAHTSKGAKCGAALCCDCGESNNSRARTELFRDGDFGVYSGCMVFVRPG